MTRTIIDVHVLQTVPPSNLNRDDTGSPKTAVYGGVRRARVSSQAWKRAARRDFADQLDSSELGTRTKRVVELLRDRIVAARPSTSEEDAQAAAAEVLSDAGIVLKEPRNKKGAPPESSYLLFLSAQQIDALGRLAIESLEGGSKPDKKTAQALVKGKNSVDLALFGRMVADVTDLNVDAACQVAHALSTHAVETEYDYFTAVDDHKAADEEEDAGAGMIGTVEFTSATLYRYATIDVDLLAKNLGDPAATERAVSAFLRAAQQGDVDGLVRLLHPAVTRTADPQALPPGAAQRVRGAQAVVTETRALQASAQRARVVTIDGWPGIAVMSEHDLRAALVFRVAGDRIAHYDVISDPQRLALLRIGD